jgi:hypothetical protein
LEFYRRDPQAKPNGAGLSNANVGCAVPAQPPTWQWSV